MKRISELTERELIEMILLLYTGQVKEAHEIAAHIAIKLGQRRKLLRERRKAA